jgi:drug/metabolite transporter (DMT)-like permease
VAFWGTDATFGQHLSPLLLGLGVVIGILFVCSYVLMVLSIRRLGVTIPISLMRLSAVLPTFGSILFFAEVPNPLQWGGIVLAFLALPLASTEWLSLSNLVEVLQNGFGWGLLLFGVFGITNFIFKIQLEVAPLHNPYHFLAVLFPVAFFVSCFMLLRYKTFTTQTGMEPRADVTTYDEITPQSSQRILLAGLILGTLNVFSNYFFMRSLQQFPGIVVYPVNGIGIILLSAITSLLLWQERLSKKNYVFIVLASLALFLIYPRS